MLKVSGLSVAYGPIQAVRDVSFEVRQGELVSLLGSNGAGKSTTLRAVSGLIRASSGSVTIEGRNLLALAPSARVSCGIAHVPEGRRVFASMSVFENLALGGYTVPGLAMEETLGAVFDLFPLLRERRNQTGGTLSGGEQQMLAIGRALMSRPKLLIMDEPTMGLSPKMVDVILAKIDDIRRQGTTILMVEQNAMDAIRMSSRVYVMRTGGIVFEGAGDALTPDIIKALYLG
ncbi:MAG: ABC transporter ATP-binding protein [Rhizobiaceae bacterium]|jgi:branched-chain amino acid transport system ATP-binding protein